VKGAESGQIDTRASIEFSQPSDRENAVSRMFHAPIDRVFQVFTDPAYAPSVFAPNPADVTIEEMDVRPGGRFSIVVKGPDGSTIRFFGEYLEVVPPRRVVNTFNVTALPGVRAIETDELEAMGEYTRLSVRWKFDSREDRDKMYGPEFQRSVSAGWVTVDHVLESMR
jgi:uncharacterized protein YndB with AHSA1/START domain